MTNYRSIPLTALVVLAFAGPALATNSVVVESRSFHAGQAACTLGVFITNEDSLQGIGLMFELRTVSGGAYFGPTGPANSFLIRMPGRRLDASPLGSAGPQGEWPAASIALRIYETPAGQSCSGPISQSWGASVPTLTGTSPDAVSFGSLHTGDENIGEPITMSVGADPVVRDSASFIFLFNANSNVGCFEIDTACSQPVFHTFFHPLTGFDGQIITPEFTKSVVCLTPCECDCHGDPAQCNSHEYNVLDIHAVIEVALRHGNDVPDPNPDCPRLSTDLNCDGTTSIIDIIKMVEVVFRNGSPAVVICNPCQ